MMFLSVLAYVVEISLNSNPLLTGTNWMADTATLRNIEDVQLQFLPISGPQFNAASTLLSST